MRKLLLVALLLLCAALLSAQDDWYVGKPIADFAFSGLDTVSELELRPIVDPYKGTPFSLASFWEIQDRLYALDYFESIEASAKPGDDQQASVIVEFAVKEKPSVAEVILQGNRRLRKNEILERVLIKVGDMVTQTQAELDAQAIADLYLEKGYTDATVTARLEPAEETNMVNLKFTIAEGVQTAIKSISFSGNSFASESTLRRTMKTKVQSLFSTGLFQEIKFEEDLQNIVDYYTGRGYIDARIEKVDRRLEKDETEGKNYLYITIYIEEGQQWIYGGMSFEGNRIFSTEELQALVRQSPGSVLSRIRLEADTQRVADLYYENGYIFNIIDRAERRDQKTREIFYVIRVTENDRAHIENIIVKGNEKTKDYVIYRELPFEEGDVFSKAKVLQGLQNLYNLQYFTSIQPETPPGSADGLMDLVVNVEEGSTANINFGVTFGGGTYPVSGLLKWEENNFLGRGQKLGVNAELSTIRQLISLTFEEPWLLGRRWLGGVTLSLEHAEVPNVLQDMMYPDNGDEPDAAPDPYPNYDAWQAAIAAGETIPDQYLMDYTLWNLSLGFSMGYRHYFSPWGWLGFRSGISTNLERVSYDPDLYRPYDANLRESNEDWKNVNKLGVTLFWDRRDFFLNPTKGSYVAQGATFAVGFPLGTRQYIRTDSTVEGFLTLFDVPVGDDWNFKMVLAAHSALSFILPEEAVAITNDLLYVDGWNVARGWPLERNKRVLWDNRLELRLPIAQQLLWWAFFLDGVTAYDQVSQFGQMALEDFYFSFGGGLRFTIPQFPIRLYLARRFQWNESESRFKGVEGGLPFFGTTVDFVISLGGDVF